VKIGTNLECGGAIINAREHALACDQAQVGGSIHFIKGFRAGGEVRLHRAKIEEHLVCTDSSFCGILIAQQMTVKGTFFWQSNNGNEVDLFGASVAQVCDDLSSWCRFHKITLDNFTYGTLAKVGKIEDRIGWIEKSQNSEYLPQLYEQMAKVLKEMGCRGWAQEVMVAQHRRREQFGNLSRREKTQSQLYGLIDYGYMPWRKSMKYLFLTWLVGWLVIPPFSTSPKSRVKPQGPTSAWA
jgi:hypothetical protein